MLMQDAAVLAARAIGSSHFGVVEFAPNSDSLTLRLGRTAMADGAGNADEYELDPDPAVSISGYALMEAKPVVAGNLDQEDRFSDAWLRRCGIRSAIVCPLRYVDHCFGTLGIYHTCERSFDKTDVLFVESIAHLMTATLARQRAEQELTEKERFSLAVLTHIDTPVLMLTGEGRIENVNAAFSELTGFSPGELKGRDFSSICFLPEDTASTKQALTRIAERETPVRFENFILTKQGQRCRIAWSLCALDRGPHPAAPFVATGIDVTQHHDTLRRLQVAKARASQAEKSLQELRRKIDGRELTFDRAGKLVPPKQAPERRRRPRHPYPYVQYIAPIEGNELPPRESFRRVRCRDLSATGFSIYCKERPHCDRIVIAFGAEPKIIYLIAEIVHVTPITYKGENVFLVGCRYVGRADYSRQAEYYGTGSGVVQNVQ
jgi:PAS domain S-box-containing protein